MSRRESLALPSVKPVSLGTSVVPLRDTRCRQRKISVCVIPVPRHLSKCHTNSFSLFDLGASQAEGQYFAANFPGP